MGASHFDRAAYKLAWQRQWRANNRELFNAQARQYRAEHVARERAAKRARYTENPEPERERSRRYRAENPETVHLAYRKNRLKELYGITLEGYDRLLHRQHGRCAICKQPESRKGRGGRTLALSVDHDHKTKRVRGLLCSACNISIHKAEASSSWLRAVVSYLSQ